MSKRTLDLETHKKRLDFIQKMLDLIYEYQDVLTSTEMILFDHYVFCEREMIEEINK